jgi:hypothetical protein
MRPWSWGMEDLIILARVFLRLVDLQIFPFSECIVLSVYLMYHGHSWIWWSLFKKLLIVETNMYIHIVFAIKLISEAHLKYFQYKSNQFSKCYLVACELKFVSTVDLYQW